MKAILVAFAFCAAAVGAASTATAQPYQTRERVIVRDHHRGWERGPHRRWERPGRVCRTIIVRRYGETRRIRECRR